MKILQINTRHYLGGGDSTYTFNLAKVLMEKGHEVEFFAMVDKRNFIDKNADLFVSYIDFKELNRHKNLVTGLKVISRSIYSTEARIKFRQLLDRVQPDLVHLQNIHAHITPSVIFEAKKHKLPVVWTLHDYKLACPNSHFLIDATGEICEACNQGSYYKAIQLRCKKGSILASTMAAVEAYAHRLLKVREKIDAFLTPSLFLKNKLVEHGFNPSNIFHIPLFVPDDMFSCCSTDDGYILFFGKLDKIKGIQILIEASKKIPNIQIILAGKCEEQLHSELPQLLHPNIKYEGIKHGEELKNIIYRARAVVLPSLTYENQPLSILEAFASAKPVIASDLGGMTELVKDKERGLLVPPGDVDALADAISWMDSHATDAHLMGRNAQAYAREEHSGEKHYQRLMQIYEFVMNKKVTV